MMNYEEHYAEVVKKTVEELIGLSQRKFQGVAFLTEEEQKEKDLIDMSIAIMQDVEGLIPVKTETEFVYRVVFKVSYYQFFYDFASAEEAAEFSRTVMLHQVPSPDNKSGSVYVRIEVLTREEAERKKKEAEDDED